METDKNQYLTYLYMSLTYFSSRLLSYLFTSNELMFSRFSNQYEPGLEKGAEQDYSKMIQMNQ